MVLAFSRHIKEVDAQDWENTEGTVHRRAGEHHKVRGDKEKKEGITRDLLTVEHLRKTVNRYDR